MHCDVLVKGFLIEGDCIENLSEEKLEDLKFRLASLDEPWEC